MRRCGKNSGWNCEKQVEPGKKKVERLFGLERRLPVTLPLESGLLTNCQETTLPIGHHQVKIARTRISPFEIRMYGEKEELQHAIQYQNVKISGIEYMDGTLVEEDAYINVTKGRTDERTGGYYIGVDLTTAIDLEKYSGIVLVIESLCIGFLSDILR